MSYEKKFKECVLAYMQGGHTQEGDGETISGQALSLANAESILSLHCNTVVRWTVCCESMLLPCFKIESTIIMDNACFHQKKVLGEMAQRLDAASCFVFLFPRSQSH